MSHWPHINSAWSRFAKILTWTGADFYQLVILREKKLYKFSGRIFSTHLLKSWKSVANTAPSTCSILLQHRLYTSNFTERWSACQKEGTAFNTTQWMKQKLHCTERRSSLEWNLRIFSLTTTKEPWSLQILETLLDDIWKWRQKTCGLWIDPHSHIWSVLHYKNASGAYQIRPS